MTGAMRVAVLVPSAGLSTRFGRNKLHETLDGRSVLRRTIDAFADRADTALIILATPAGLPPASTLPGDVIESESLRLVEGGPTRADSVRAALAVVPGDVDWIAVHDAARPLVSPALIDRVYAHAAAHGSAVPAMPVKLTIKEAAGPLPAAVVRTLPRTRLWEMQTPQVMRRSDLLAAYDRCPVPLSAVTDDAQLLELAGLPVWLVAGEESNLKLTTAQDLVLAKAALVPSPGTAGRGDRRSPADGAGDR